MNRLLPARLREPLLVLLLCTAVIALVFYPAVFQGQLIYQEDSAGSSGMGLGLPISKGLLEAMEGSIQIKSGTGSGTTVRVLLPLADG